jgi:hypothetical protein
VGTKLDCAPLLSLSSNSAEQLWRASSLGEGADRALALAENSRDARFLKRIPFVAQYKVSSLRTLVFVQV